jgi:hypothetical protein
MAFPTGTETSTTLAVMIPQLWGAKINDFYRQKLKLAAFFTNRSDELAGGGDTVYTPGLTEMAANAKSNATQVTLNQPTETKQTLELLHQRRPRLSSRSELLPLKPAMTASINLMASASGQRCDRDVGPNQTVKNEKNALRILQLKERRAVRVLHGFDPENRRCRQDISIEPRGDSSR